jgi:long-chain acyl-CoA synthetase
MKNKPWLRQYDIEVPALLRYPGITIQGFLLQQAEKDPQRIALICEGKSINYGDLLSRSKSLAKKLVALGLKTGGRVGICLPNTIEFVISYYGSLLAGGIVAAMNPTYPLAEWTYQTNIAHPQILIGSWSRKNDLYELKQLKGIAKLILVETGIGESEFIQSETDRDYLLFDQCFPSEENETLPVVLPDEPALLQFSGGTTGLPKAAMALHKNVVANIIQFKRWLTTMKDGQDVFLTIIPLYHVYGMVIGLNVGIAMGATIVLVPDSRDLEKVLNLVQEYKVTFFPGVPTIYNAINHHPKVLAGEINLRSIKACISGSAPLLQETRIQFEKLTGGKLVEGYGLSEAPTATHCNPIKRENRSGSIGLPLPDVNCRIVELEDDTKDVETGEIGELLIRSPQIMQGYYRSPEETQIVLKNGWLHTGDIAKMDKDGYFYIVGRRKELIKVNGLQVWPTEVENVLVKFSGVKECAVAGIPNSDTGEAVKAWLVLDQPEKFNMQALVDFCRDQLAAYKIPKEAECVESLPKLPAGKILRRELVRKNGEQNRQPGA